MDKKRIAIAVISVLQLSACANNPLYQGYSVAPVSPKMLEPYTELKATLTASSSPWVDNVCFGSELDTNAASRCAWQRNQVIAALVIGSEEACMAHRRSMYGNEAAYNIGLGTATSLFAGWAAVISNTHPYRASILSALALFSNSERSLINETVYKTMIVTAVDKKIVEVRDAKATQLHAKLDKTFAQYGMNQALADWTDFHKSCSFMTGLQKALDEGTQGGDALRLLKLNQAFRSITADITLSCPGTTSSPTCTKLNERLTQVTNEIKTLETK